MKYHLKQNVRYNMNVLIETDYSKFKYILGNRMVKNRAVQRLKLSIIQYGYYHNMPIEVDLSFNILDGQHRLEAVKELARDTGEKIPIPYFINSEYDADENEKEREKALTYIQNKNATQLGWTNLDYADSWAKRDYYHYRKYMQFRKDFQLGHTAILILSDFDYPGAFAEFKDGLYVVQDWNEVYKYGKYVKELINYRPFAKETNFLRAITPFWKCKKFDHKEFVRKLNFDRERLYQTRNSLSYRRSIAAIYNYKRTRKISFKINETTYM